VEVLVEVSDGGHDAGNGDEQEDDGLHHDLHGRSVATGETALGYRGRGTMMRSRSPS
jgi:hypothetical protein